MSKWWFKLEQVTKIKNKNKYVNKLLIDFVKTLNTCKMTEHTTKQVTLANIS